MGTCPHGIIVTGLRQICPNPDPTTVEPVFRRPLRTIMMLAHCSAVAGKERLMRLILGMILGAALTIGGAYVYDTASKPGPDARPMVNWDVVAKNTDSVIVMIKQGWAKLTG